MGQKKEKAVRRLPITVSVDQHTITCLREIASKLNCSLSRLVENYLRNVLNEYRRTKGDLKADEKLKGKTIPVKKGLARSKRKNGSSKKQKG